MKKLLLILTLLITTSVFAQTDTLIVAVNEIEDELKVYPNPTVSHINISYKGLSEVRLYSAQGKILHKLSIKDYATIDTSYLPSGIYLLFIERNKLIVTRKIIKCQ